MDDLISRQALLDKFEQWQKNDGYSNGEWNLLVDVLNVIKSMPPAPQLGTNLAEDGTDCISRQAAIEALGEEPLVWHEDDAGEVAERNQWRRDVAAIEALTSAQPEQRWIPWSSGKLPEESGTYTVTAYDGVTNRVTYAKYQKRLKRWELTGARAYWRVLAWMPLPEPYKGGGEQDE